MSVYEILNVTVTPIVTVIAGSTALFLYYKQKRDERAGIASIILLEIQQAENAVETIRYEDRIDESISVLPSNTWSKSHHLFIKKLNHDDRVLLTNFYTECEIIEAGIKEYLDYAYISRVEKVKETQKYIAKLHSGGSAARQIDEKLEGYFDNSQWFMPFNAKTVIDKYTKRIRFISNTPLEVKLRDIAHTD